MLELNFSPLVKRTGEPTHVVAKVLAGLPNVPGLIRGQDYERFAADIAAAAAETVAVPRIHALRLFFQRRYTGGTMLYMRVEDAEAGHLHFATAICMGSQPVVMRIAAGTGQLIVAIGEWEEVAPPFDNEPRADPAKWRVLLPNEEQIFAMHEGADNWAQFSEWYRPLVLLENGRLPFTLVHWTLNPYVAGQPVTLYNHG